MAKLTTITIETTSLLILRGGHPRRAWCRQCGADAEIVPVGNMGLLSKLDQLAVAQWLASSDLHWSEAPDGTALLCLSSLLARVQNTK